MPLPVSVPSSCPGGGMGQRAAPALLLFVAAGILVPALAGAVELSFGDGVPRAIGDTWPQGKSENEVQGVGPAKDYVDVGSAP